MIASPDSDRRRRRRLQASPPMSWSPWSNRICVARIRVGDDRLGRRGRRHAAVCRGPARSAGSAAAPDHSAERTQGTVRRRRRAAHRSTARRRAPGDQAIAAQMPRPPRSRQGRLAELGGRAARRPRRGRARDRQRFSTRCRQSSAFTQHGENGVEYGLKYWLEDCTKIQRHGLPWSGKQMQFAPSGGRG